MKIATDLEQSKKLAEFLPIESADMEWVNTGYSWRLLTKNDEDAANSTDIIHSWSLPKLMDILPIQFDWEFKTHKFKMQTDFYSSNSSEKYYDLGYQGAYGWLEYEDSTELVDACVNLIIKLHEREII